jgi:hypothetical protein
LEPQQDTVPLESSAIVCRFPPATEIGSRSGVGVVHCPASFDPQQITARGPCSSPARTASVTALARALAATTTDRPCFIAFSSRGRDVPPDRQPNTARLENETRICVISARGQEFVLARDCRTRRRAPARVSARRDSLAARPTRASKLRSRLRALNEASES